MIPMLVLQNAPRLSMFVAGWYFRFAQQHGQRTAKSGGVSQLAVFRCRTQENLICFWQQTGACRLVQGALIATLVLLLVW